MRFLQTSKQVNSLHYPKKMSFKREEGVIKYQNIVHVEREKPLLKTNTKKMDEHISKELS